MMYNLKGSIYNIFPVSVLLTVFRVMLQKIRLYLMYIVTYYNLVV
jgi:hypothetical protein